jgi:hypothetical protein
MLLKHIISLTFGCLLTLSLNAQCVDGDCINGQGVLQEKGNLLVGTFKNGKLTGKGICHFSWGAKYIGEFTNGNFEGKGTYYHTDGTVENGIWSDGIISEEQPIAAPTKNTTYVIIIGINEYTDENLHFAVNDANSIDQYLQSSSVSSRNVIETELILNQDATLSNVKTQIKTVASKAKANEAILFFFLGKSQGKEMKLQDGTLSIEAVQKLLDASKAKQRLCFVDMSQAGDDEVWENIKGQQKTPTTSDKNQVILVQKDKEISIEADGLRYGIFTHYLMQALKGAADKDVNGSLTSKEIHQYIKRKINNYSNGGHTVELFQNSSNTKAIDTFSEIK